MVAAIQSIQVLALLFGFFLFSLGLYETSQWVGALLFRSTDGDESPELRSVHFVLGIIFYAGFCNAILLIPSLAEWIFRLPPALALAWHHASLLLLMAVVVALALRGLLALAGRFPRPASGLAARPMAGPLGALLQNRDDGSGVFFLAAAWSTYLMNTIRGSYIYDSGLYHFPFINHGRQFGLEIGLANLHSRYAYYNIQNFGQIPLQAFSPAADLISPSLNLLFLAALLMAAYDAVRRSYALAGRSLASLGTLSYWLLALMFGLTGSASIISFDADFSLSIATLMTLYFYFVAGHSGTIPRSVLALTACLPLLKLAGVLSVLFACVFALALLVLSAGWQSWRVGGQIIAAQWKQWQTGAGRRLSLLLPGLYALLLLTSLTLSGYALYPQAQTGPIGDHAVAKQAVKIEKDIAILSWARQGLDRTAGDNKPIPTQQWVPKFLRTRRGSTLALWLSSAGLIVLLSAIACLTERGRRKFRILAAFSLATSIASLAVLLILPPDPRFYAWLRPISFFNILYFVQLAPAFGVMAVTLFASFIAAVSHQPIARMKPAAFQRMTYLRTSQLPLWHARVAGETVVIRSPLEGDQCWTVEPPCRPMKPKQQPAITQAEKK